MDMDRPFLHRHNSHKLTTVGWERTVANDEPFTIEHGMGISDILFLQFDDGESHIWRERQQSVTANGNNTPAKKKRANENFRFFATEWLWAVVVVVIADVAVYYCK